MIERRPLRQSTQPHQQKLGITPLSSLRSNLQSAPLPLLKIGDVLNTQQAIRALQRSHGNQATMRMIGCSAASTRNTAYPIQRLLMTSTQFTNAVGYKPHRNIKLPGKTLKEQSTHYKAVLEALDDYHEAIRKTTLNDGGALRLFDEKLDFIVSCCKEYLGRETEPDAKMKEWLNRLVNEASGEKRVLRQAARNMPNQFPSGTRWDALMGAGEAGGLTIPRGAEVERKDDPGVEANFSKNADIFTDAGLKSSAGKVNKGDLCVRHETSHPKVLFVETYTLDKSKDKSKPVFGPSGFVDAKSVGKSKFSHKSKGADRPIFPNPPCLEDINQQAIGDCFLLAALGGIVKANPDLIYRMIRDNRDGTVTVRLYDMTKLPPAATYLQITKSLISHGRRSKGALWVPLIEKAYTALGVKYQDDVAVQGSSSYLQLGEGGFSHQAFMVLTGTPGAQASQPEEEARNDILAAKPWGRAEILKYEAHQAVLRGDKKALANGTYLEQMYSYPILDQDPALIAKWVEFLGKGDVVATLDKADRVEAFQAVFKQHQLDPTVQAKMLVKVRQHYQGKRGTGQYSPTQLRYFRQIEQALADKKYVALGTPKTVAKTEEGKGHSAGESVAKGLVGTHAYTVISVRFDQVTGRRWVRVRNPWGDYGRVYEENTGEKAGSLSANKTSEAEFDLELSDLTKRFNHVYFSG